MPLNNKDAHRQRVETLVAILADWVQAQLAYERAATDDKQGAAAYTTRERVAEARKLLTDALEAML
jgi:hypothetical protein